MSMKVPISAVVELGEVAAHRDHLINRNLLLAQLVADQQARIAELEAALQAATATEKENADGAANVLR
ncbi:hypothetical protein BJF92_11355 [Rhizobium rhizosphaerae]|uniref:Uncharacterized protein n=1 Tax=Xaviernesmea rhizosphaerae TaxID=1672749 RepID=A0A1Q9AMP7_9HYPH|nr:hypothetical protein [Xaviernesmea rhizosphaerae]OLP56678.1 hypothetical protein BJF92_11355 [Xaviernesmea rhizosphaerae]